MELSALLQDLHLSSEEPRPPLPLPPITELLSRLQEKLTSDEAFGSSTLIGRVERLFRTADPNWLFSADQREDGWAELQALYGSVIRALIGCAALPLRDDDCIPLTPAAYLDVPARAAAVSAALMALLETLGNWEKRGGVTGDLAGLPLTVAPPLCVFTVTHFQVQAWTSTASTAAARHLHEALLRAGSWRDSAHLLIGEEGGRKGILGEVLDILQPQLSKDSWWRCDAVKLVFAWTLLQVTRPALSPHLSRLLPPSLLLVDHHRPDNCMLGVRCLHHIVLNTPAADLRQFNRAEVLYQALYRHLYTPEPAVIQVVLSCLLDLLLVLEKPPSSPSSFRKPCRHDDVLRLLLTHMEAEHKVALRCTYATALPAFIDRMGVAVCRHLQRVERVVLGYLEVSDPPEEKTRLQILEALQRTIRVAWPRMQCRAHSLLRCLLRLLVDVSVDCGLCEPLRQQLMDQSAICIKLLDACCHGDIQALLQQVDSSCCSSQVLGCIATATTRR
ncbi:TELO2-interacting protein 2 [Parambassis ranga]|uniref:TELO2-interacting protein 2 n=1 Tax=Parambassis ranga TaxID=210632 RepID=A0A6P7J1Q1_9TELE|nr:TELO2-interacting protein 2 [Parambassis ranga]